MKKNFLVFDNVWFMEFSLFKTFDRQDSWMISISNLLIHNTVYLYFFNNLNEI